MLLVSSVSICLCVHNLSIYKYRSFSFIHVSLSVWECVYISFSFPSLSIHKRVCVGLSLSYLYHKSGGRSENWTHCILDLNGLIQQRLKGILGMQLNFRNIYSIFFLLYWLGLEQIDYVPYRERRLPQKGITQSAGAVEYATSLQRGKTPPHTLSVQDI